MRGFQIEDRDGDFDENDEPSLKRKIREEMIQKLAREWNEYHTRLEHRSWRSDEDRDEEADYLSEMAEEFAQEKLVALANFGSVSFTEEDIENFPWDHRREKFPKLAENILKDIKEHHRKFIDEFYAKQKEKDSEDALRIQVIEELLSDLGGRMMRPYEHWNEEEHIREYMERDRDYE
jgi:hypothetical protein